MIRQCEDVFILQTAGSAYVFRRTETGHLEHLHYGAPLGWGGNTPDSVIKADCAALVEKRVFELGNVIALDTEHKAVNLEDMCQELSSYGKGDIRDPFVIVRLSDGSISSDFRFVSAERGALKPPEGLPGAYAAEGEAERLTVTLQDSEAGLTLELYYDVFSDCDVICRSSRMINAGSEAVTVLRLMSTQLDFNPDVWDITCFHGAWAREMERETQRVGHSRIVNSSFTGTSSNRANPFVMLHRPDTTRISGACWGLNLIYSGNHYESAQLNAWGKLRFLSGINPEQFAWTLEPGEAFSTPQAIMAFSMSGFGGMSREMHYFIRRHIVRGPWRDRPRPILLNSWEACYFDVSEDRILRLAKAAAETGVELIVLDDGWFAGRDDDAHSLGDWYVNRKKFPSDLAGLSSKLKNMGLLFGLWIEPEMVNTDSDLYRAHPDWVMQIPGRSHAEGRNQRVLDLGNPEVVEYLSRTLGDVIEKAQLSYVKWDMNRIFSDVFSTSLPPRRQGETAHRYVMGLYKLMGELTSRFPEILFEACASGGNRFDPGMLCYCPQIWASDNTDAISRAHIQEGYSYGYPLSTVGAHLSSSPNHQTLRKAPLSTRFAVAAFGVLGLELNLPDLPGAARDKVQAHLTVYKAWRDVLQFGNFYLLSSGNVHKWICVSEDRRRAVGMLMREKAEPNSQYEEFRAEGLDPNLRYRFYNIPKRVNLLDFGDLVNTVSPVHIRQDSLAHNVVARFVVLPGEQEEYTVSGAALMNSGVRLAPAFGGTGFNERTRVFPDFSARLYFMEAVDDE